MSRKNKGPVVPTEIGIHFGERDLYRIGQFQEIGYLTEPNKPSKGLWEERVKGKQMIAPFPKWKRSLQDCYFDHTFKRIFIGEAIVRKKEEEEETEKKPFHTVFSTKKSSTPGDFYGTFSGVVEAFSPLLYPQPKKKRVRKNFLTRPGKKGGCGYLDITINPYPKHMDDPYDGPPEDKKKKTKAPEPMLGGFYPRDFDPNPWFIDEDEEEILPPYKFEPVKKWTKFGPFYPPASAKLGPLLGRFGTYPEHLDEPYVESARIMKVLDEMTGHKKDPLYDAWKPPPSNRSYQNPSVMARNIKTKINQTNWRFAKPVTYTRRFVIAK